MRQAVSHYEILGKAGEGGMGVVYQARDTTLGRLVALKFVPSQIADTGAHGARFEEEARAISALNHPHIATIYGLEEFEGDRFLVLEYLPGDTLRSRIRELRERGECLSLEKILDYACGLAEGLAHAHRRGIIHRDVKTDNAMFTEEGAIKLTDFGLAKLRGSAALTLPGTVVGTVAYMSPEQGRGEEIDQRSDIFSFGVLLFEMATGELPFQGPHTIAVMKAVAGTPAPPVAKFRPELPEAFGKIVERALVKDPAGRYQSMDELRADLEALRQRSDLQVTRTILDTRPRSAQGEGRSRRIWLWAAGLVLTILVAALLWRYIPRLPGEKHIAVLPFTSLGPERADQAFCEGMVETLTAKLSQLQQFQNSLWVVPASEVRALPVSSAGQARQVFGATLVVTGSVQRVGSRIRLIANLVDAATRQQLASRTIDTGMEDLAELQDSVAERVVEMLQLELQPEARRALAAGKTTVPAAYQAYEQGHGYLKRLLPEDLDLAIQLLNLAIEKDPNYAAAYAELGEAYSRKYKLTKDPQWMEKSSKACARALELNDRLESVRLTVAYIDTRTGKYEEAVKELRRLLEIDPANSTAYHDLALTYDDMGKLEEAEATYQKAIKLRSDYWAGYNDLGFHYFRHGQYAKAEPLFRMAIALTPGNVLAYNNLGGVYNAMGRYEDAAGVLRKSLEIRPSASGYSNLGTIYIYLGRYGEAVPMMEEAVALRPADHVLWGNLGDAYRGASGLAAKSLPAYRKAIELAGKQLAVNPNDAQLLASVAVWQAKLGEKQPALAEIAKALEHKPALSRVIFKSAIVYELSGKRDGALSALEATLKAGYSTEEIQREPELARLRQDPRYPKLMERWSSPVSSRP